MRDLIDDAVVVAQDAIVSDGSGRGGGRAGRGDEENDPRRGGAEEPFPSALGPRA